MSDSEPIADGHAERERYLLLADISGYTSFLKGVEQAHSVDFSSGMPAGYTVLGELLDAVVRGLQPIFEIAKLEGDAVFAVSPAAALDGRGGAVMQQLGQTYRAFRAAREDAKGASDHICTACPVVANLDLKMILHRGTAVRVEVGTHADMHGPAVNIVHRLLKNTVRARIGNHAYLFVTDEAAAGLGLTDAGVEHREVYPDVGAVAGRIVSLA